jgi:hypothetical protein
MPRAGFEPTIAAFERAKTVHTLDRAAAMIGTEVYAQEKLIKENARPKTFY